MYINYYLAMFKFQKHNAAINKDMRKYSQYWLYTILAEADLFLKNIKMINIIFNYIFGLTFESPSSKFHFQMSILKMDFGN